ncbi:MAG: hypothetical protein GKR98_02625 [Boseongicola sp.]|nr:MAG: hypothetical protein GKR98_02625 [Boseongicola sp.]
MTDQAHVTAKPTLEITVPLSTEKVWSRFLTWLGKACDAQSKTGTDSFRDII